MQPFFRGREDHKIALPVQDKPKARPSAPKRQRKRAFCTRKLATELRVTERQVYTWIRRGCPHGKASGRTKGRRGHRFDLLEVKAWLVSQGIAPREPAAAATAPPPSADEERLGYEPMVDRVQRAESATFAAWANALNAKRPAAEIAALARLWLEQVDALRKVEKDQSAVRRHDKDWLSRAEAETAFRRLAQEVKTALLALPRSLAPRCADRKAPEIEALLADEIHGVLQLLADPTSGSGGKQA